MSGSGSRRIVTSGPSRVLSNRPVGSGWYVLRLLEPTVAEEARPGMFVQVACAERGSFDPLLRRPFSVYVADRRRGTFDVLYTVVGRGTRWLASLPDPPAGGEAPRVDVLGPVGNSFRAPGDAEHVFLVGGGVGVAPLYFLARELLETRSPPITACIGARTAALLQGAEDFRRLDLRAEVSTDDGSRGFPGRVTELLERLLEDVRDPGRVRIYGCGPQGMNESLRALAVARGLWCEICLESLMACGFGICFGCVAPIRDVPGGPYRNRRICWEGPVFDCRLLCPGIERNSGPAAE